MQVGEERMKVFECVNKGEYETDPHQANYENIEAENRNQAKYIYAKRNYCSYIEVLCRTQKGYPQWN